MQTVYIFGHKIPDTDAVCASISLSYLRNKLGDKTEPRIIGDINRETKFVLDYFGIKEPLFLNDVKVRIKDMNYNKEAMINENSSIYETYQKLIRLGVTGIPLVDNQKRITGYVNVKAITEYLIDGDMSYINTSYDNLLSTLKGNEVLRFDEEIDGRVIATQYKSNSFFENIFLNKEDILIVDNNNFVLNKAVSVGVKLLIVVNNVQIGDVLLEQARESRVNIISVNYNTFKCVNLIKLCNYVKIINTSRNLCTFNISDYRNDFIEKSNKLGHTNYPIVSKNGTCLGMLRLIDANDYEKRKVILVDHNQLSQSVDGIEEADILEIIDHHNLGVFGTKIPINFRSMPVGASCTLIYKLFQEANVEIPRNVAGIMLAAILSDTLLFKSPTVTELDIEVANILADIAEVNINVFGHKMFKAASSIEGMNASEIINYDLKSFKYEDSALALSQVMTMDFDEISQKEEDIISILNSMCKIGNYKYAVLFITDVIKNGSYIYYSNSAKDKLIDAFGLNDIYEGVYIDGIVSRKKQMLPPLLEEEERRA